MRCYENEVNSINYNQTVYKSNKISAPCLVNADW